MNRKKKTNSIRTTSAKGASKAHDFEAVFAALKNTLVPYAQDLHVLTDKPGIYQVETRSPVYKGRPLYFAGVRTGKNYVSFYLMPVYMNPVLQQEMSPQLKKRMQGKACFNFTAPDPALFHELSALTASGFQCFRSPKFPEACK